MISLLKTRLHSHKTFLNNLGLNNLGLNNANTIVKVGWWRRSFAIFIDLFILDICTKISVYPLHKGLNELYDLDIFSFLIEVDSDILRVLILYFISYIIIGVILSCFYFIYFHGYLGQTIGKRLLKIKVIQIDGGGLTWKRAFMRWMGYFVSWFPFFLGFIWVVFDKDKQAWHDKIASTYVVRV
ncbi:MAG: RDD family protein [Nitrospinae bacterium]|nr:RDD family protein [Nitrospinota bacterium]